MAEFDRSNPLFERNSVPFEIIVSPSNLPLDNSHSCASSTKSNESNKRYGNFTVRILQGHRPHRNGGGSVGGGGMERVIRFEMSDECNLVGEDEESAMGNIQGTPGRSIREGSYLPYQTPNTAVPIIHAPFMTADRVGRCGSLSMSSMQNQGHRRQISCSSNRISNNRPIELYELEVGESDFADLRQDQALLVDFNDFANSLISLLQYCELGEEETTLHPQEQTTSFHRTSVHDINFYNQQPPCPDQQPRNPSIGFNNHINMGTWSTPSHQTPHPPLNQPGQGMQYQGQRTASPYGKVNASLPVSTYTCRLETNSPAAKDNDMQQWRNAPKTSNASNHARFSIVESNQFRELTHLALNLNVGTDKSVRLYLSSRLGQTMMQNKSIQSLFEEQQRRSDAAETDLIGLNKRLRELTQSSEAEKCQIRYQAEERLRTENCSRLAEVNEVKSVKDAEIKALNNQSEKNRVVLENKIRTLEDINAKINAEKTASENNAEKTATKLSYQETTNKTLTNEMSSLRSQLLHVSEEKASMEKSLHQLQLQLSSLQFSNNDQEKTISQTEAQRISAEKVSADAKQTLSRQQLQIAELRKRLEEAENETSKYKDLTSRYQTNRVEMKKRIKEKVEMIREQEEVLIAREKEATELKHRVQGLEKNLQRVQTENEAVSQRLNDVMEQTEEDKKKLENNQQVIAWLNKQVNTNRQVSHIAGTKSNAYPTPSLPRSNVPPTATLNASTPYKRSFVTPVTGDKQLHPQPTPFTRMPQNAKHLSSGDL